MAVEYHYELSLWIRWKVFSSTAIGTRQFHSTNYVNTTQQVKRQHTNKMDKRRIGENTKERENTRKKMRKKHNPR